MKRILVALDHSPSAERVAESGYALAKAMHAELMLLHVITEPAYYAMEYSPVLGYKGGYTTGVTALIDDIKKEAEDFLAAFVHHLGDHSIHTTVQEGETIDTILKYSEDWKADLLVTGSHTHTGINRVLLTDIAAHLLAHSTIPLLIIPTKKSN